MFIRQFRDTQRQADYGTQSLLLVSWFSIFFRGIMTPNPGAKQTRANKTSWLSEIAASATSPISEADDFAICFAVISFLILKHNLSALTKKTTLSWDIQKWKSEYLHFHDNWKEEKKTAKLGGLCDFD